MSIAITNGRMLYASKRGVISGRSHIHWDGQESIFFIPPDRELANGAPKNEKGVRAAIIGKHTDISLIESFLTKTSIPINQVLVEMCSVRPSLTELEAGVEFLGITEKGKVVYANTETAGTEGLAISRKPLFQAACGNARYLLKAFIDKPLSDADTYEVFIATNYIREKCARYDVYDHTTGKISLKQTASPETIKSAVMNIFGPKFWKGAPRLLFM